MPDPQILRLTGVEVQLELYRGSTNTFDVFLTRADGTPVPLNTGGQEKRVVLKIYDKVGGIEKYSETKEPGDHIDATNGQTRFSIPPSVTSPLTAARSFTWKYLIYMQDIVTLSKTPFFHGDIRVLVPNVPLTAQPLTVLVTDVVGLADPFEGFFV